MKPMPLVSAGIPLCSEDACEAFDGKRCLLMGFQPERICEPAVAEIHKELQQWKTAVMEQWHWATAPEDIAPEVANLTNQIMGLVGLTASLRKALKPFASVANVTPDNWPAECSLTWVIGPGCHPSTTYFSSDVDTVAPKLRDYRTAAELLRGKVP